MMTNYTIHLGDVREQLRLLPPQSVQTVITSPPYWGLRDYGMDQQLGLEKTPDAYVQQMVDVFREVWRVLKDDGVLWLNLGDSYVATPRGNKPGDFSTSSLTNPQRQDAMQRSSKPARIDGLKQKDLIGIPWRVAFALQADGWYLRSDIIWSKPNPMPESVRDRPTKSHEYIFLLTKEPRYYYNADAIREPLSKYYADGFVEHGVQPRPGTQNFNKQERYTNGTKAASTRQARLGFVNPLGKNKRSVWTVTTKSFHGAHFATFPERLIEPCVLAGSRPNDTVLDPFCGSGTTGVVALRHQRSFVGIELNPEYLAIAEKRINNEVESSLFTD